MIRSRPEIFQTQLVKEHQKPRQPRPRPHLDGEEVRCYDHLAVPAQELFSCRLSVAPRREFQAVLLRSRKTCSIQGNRLGDCGHLSELSEYGPSIQGSRAGDSRNRDRSSGPGNTPLASRQPRWWFATRDISFGVPDPRHVGNGVCGLSASTYFVGRLCDSARI